MASDTDEHGRPRPPHDGDELQTLLGFLDHQRATLAWKVRGLTDEQLRTALPVSDLTLGGMLMHLARAEDLWFSECVADGPEVEPWASLPWADEWQSAALRSGDDLRALWASRVDASRAVVASALAQDGDALGTTHSAWQGRGRVSLRWVLVHMIEEYARHNGHCDLLRQSIDGETGE